jgi:hypothetical protein
MFHPCVRKGKKNESGKLVFEKSIEWEIFVDLLDSEAIWKEYVFLELRWNRVHTEYDKLRRPINQKEII